MATSRPTGELGGADSADLLPEHVEAVFREFLGRAASAGDVSLWMGIGSLRALLDGVLGSEEYAQRCARRERSERAAAGLHYVNCWAPGWERFARTPGSMSPDGVAIVGRGGHLFIYGGANDNVATHRGEVALPARWLEAWQQLIEERTSHAAGAGWSLAYVVVPEKLAVYDDLFPQDLTPSAPRPVLQLLTADLPLVYPCDALRDARAGGDTYLSTDSHLTPSGNALLAAATLARLGVSADGLEEVGPAAEPHLGAGDLGLHFEPPLLEVMAPLTGVSRATLISDNWQQIVAAGGHIGTRRVFRNERARDRRTVVVFGDSYAFGDEAYQGLSWFLAQIFREVHFAWVPFGWDPDYVDSVGAQLVVCQTAERFIGRVPNARVDVRALEQETINRNQALTEERIFSDRRG